MSKYKQGDTLAIIYNVWISGTKLGIKKKACINSIDLKETVKGSNVATIQISDPNFLFIDDNIFLEDNSIKIKMGWSNTTYRVTFEGYISAIDINFDSSGCPKLTITCMDNTHKMNRKKKNRTFKNCTNADVVKKIVKSYGFKCKVDSNYKFTKQETITQSDQTDIDFINKLAGDEVHPFTAYLKGSTFYYVKMGKLEKKPKATLTYRDYPHDIISFSPKINKETRKSEVSSASVSTKDKNVSSSTATKNNKEGGIENSDKGKNNSYAYDPENQNWTKK